MNILFTIGRYANIGGTEKITTFLANAFAARGHRVAVASLLEPPAPEKFGLSEKVACVDASRGDGRTALIRRLLVEREIDVVLNQWCLPFYVTRMLNKARRGLRTSLVSVLHGVPDKSKKVISARNAAAKAKGLRRLAARAKAAAVDWVVRASERYVYRASDRYVLLSEAFKPDFRKYTGLGETPKLVAIPNPLTIAPPAEVAFAAKRREILYAGRMDLENKRPDRIVEAWAELAGRFPDWRLVLSGDGPDKAALERMVRERGVERVEFAPFTAAEPVERYRAADVFVLTSDLEGFGLALVEAMAFGAVPVVYGSYAAARDIVSDGAEGFVTPVPYSKDATAGALAHLMENASLREEMARAAAAKARSFSLESVVARWEGLFEELSGERSGK